MRFNCLLKRSASEINCIFQERLSYETGAIIKPILQFGKICLIINSDLRCLEGERRSLRMQDILIPCGFLQ